jgi:hypothetical protein
MTEGRTLSILALENLGQPLEWTSGEGVVVQYDEKAKEVVGLTIIGVGRRLEQHIKEVA